MTQLGSTRGVVPRTVEALGQWCYVERDGSIRDPTRNQYLAYRHEDPDRSESEEVVLRFQGFIKTMELSQYGNWSGYVPFVLVKYLLLSDRLLAAALKMWCEPVKR